MGRGYRFVYFFINSPVQEVKHFVGCLPAFIDISHNRLLNKLIHPCRQFLQHMTGQMVCWQFTTKASHKGNHTVKRQFANHELVKNHPQRIDIAGRGNVTVQQLRRCVGWRLIARGINREAQVNVLHKPRHSEVCQCSSTSFIDIDVLRTYIAVIYLHLMCHFQRVRHIHDNAQLIRLFECLLIKFGPQRTFVLITTDFIVVGLLFIHLALCVDNVGRIPNLLLCHVSVLYRIGELLQFLRTFVSHIQRIFTNPITSRSNKLRDTKVFGKFFRFLKLFLYAIIEYRGAFSAFPLYRFPREKIRQLIHQRLDAIDRTRNQFVIGDKFSQWFP